MTRALFVLCVSTVLLAFVSSCVIGGGGDVPGTSYYTLHYDVPAVRGEPRFPMTLGVEDFHVATEYRTDRLVYRESPFEVGYYNYYRWAASPEVVVRRKVMEHLVASNLFAAVEDARTAAHMDLSLEGNLERIEEIEGKDLWSAHLVLELVLSAPEKPPILRRRYDLTRDAAERTPLEIVKAMSGALEEAMRAFVAEAEKALARRKTS